MCFEYIPSNETLFKNVFKMPPANYFIVRDGKMEITEYFDLRYHIDNSKTQAEWEDIIADTFRDSTEVHGEGFKQE